VTDAHPDEIRTLAASDGTRLAYRTFLQEGRPSASLVYLHGIQSHGGWYLETAAELASRGYAFYLLDRRGSGLSGGPRGSFPSAAQLVDDVRRLVELARGEHPDAPAFILGGCWGARPAVDYALAEADALAGLILICPALKPKVDLRPAEKAKVLVGTVAHRPWRVRIPLAPELFTRNRRWLEFIRADPLALHDVEASFFFRQALWDRRLLRGESLALPMLLLQSGRDEIVDVDAVRKWFERQESQEQRYVLYPEFDHILDFEDGRARYWNDLDGWIGEILARVESREPQAARA